MNRKIERHLINIAGIWEIASGLVTLFGYGSFVKLNTLNIDLNQIDDIEIIDRVMGNVYNLVTFIGVLSLFIGMINVYIAFRLKKVRVEKKRAVWVIGIAIISYLLMDIISGLLLLIAGIIMLARNKFIRLNLGAGGGV